MTEVQKETLADYASQFKGIATSLCQAVDRFNGLTQDVRQTQASDTTTEFDGKILTQPYTNLVFSRYSRASSLLYLIACKVEAKRTGKPITLGYWNSPVIKPQMTIGELAALTERDIRYMTPMGYGKGTFKDIREKLASLGLDQGDPRAILYVKMLGLPPKH